jgi:hypothetical protein
MNNNLLNAKLYNKIIIKKYVFCLNIIIEQLRNKLRTITVIKKKLIYLLPIFLCEY